MPFRNISCSTFTIYSNKFNQQFTVTKLTPTAFQQTHIQLFNLQQVCAISLFPCFTWHKTYIPLPYVYNVQNSVQLMKDLSDIPFSPNLKLSSLDISSMYTNIPTEELLNIIGIMCDKHNIEDTIKLEIIEISKMKITQNCFKFLEKHIYKRMVSPFGPQRHPFCPKSIFNSLKTKKLWYPTVLKGGTIL